MTVDSTSVSSLFTVSRVYGHLIYLTSILVAEGHSIYVRNLPLDVTVAQLDGEFKKFGPIKQGGVQVRSNRVGSVHIVFILFHLLLQIFNIFPLIPFSAATRILLWLC